jgi:hypothetical protein
MFEIKFENIIMINEIETKQKFLMKNLYPDLKNDESLAFFFIDSFDISIKPAERNESIEINKIMKKMSQIMLNKVVVK